MKSLCNILFILAAALVLVVSPVFGADSSGPPANKKVPAAELVWPPPPLEPRIRYLRSISTSDDIRGKKGFWRKFWEFFRGPDTRAMIKPMSVAVDGKGRIYVADPAAGMIHIFHSEKRKYSFIEAIGGKELRFPIGLAVDEGDNLYVADGQRKQIFSLTTRGKPGRIYGKPGQLQRPAGIAVDSRRGLLYVADPPAHDIKIFSLDSGKLTGSIGRRGVGAGEFNFPAWLTVGAKGQLHVTDSLNGRIQTLSSDGKPVSSFGKLGDGTGSFSSPKGVAVDSDGHLYVADAGFDNIQIFDQRGRLLLYFGGSGQAPGLFWMPGGVFIDGDDRIYVADSYNRRVQIFQYLKAKGSP
ncbi:MAG TPA: 6-bladed beta-propeller [Gammaproteobacteria bacterium]|nr:6-bladed beta-propeller [Gammaproteobacteria bacterium]